MPTASVVVASVTWPALSVVQPPPVDAPDIAIDPQEISPEPLVCRAWLPVQVVTPPSVKGRLTLAVPVTSSGRRVGCPPTPPFPAKYAFPVVVAPPLTVSPPICVPLPMVEEA